MACRHTAFVLLICAGFSWSGLKAHPRFDTTKLGCLINAVNDHNKIMGSLTVAKKGRILYNRAWGYRHISDSEKLTSNTETRFRIGSISKMFTSVIILQLAEEKKLSLSTPLSTYYPDLPNASRVTIEHLLNHHSGLYNFTDSSYESWRTRPHTKEQLLELFGQQPVSFQPGATAEYSNTNYVLLGLIIEQVTGESYAANVKKRITDKIGLKHTYYGAAPDPAKNEASSFSFDGRRWIAETPTDLSITGGAGSLVSTPSDLVRFADALFRLKLIKKASLDRMILLKDNFGLGIFQFPFDEKYAYGHTGGIDEFHALLGYFPKDSVAFAFTGNGQTIDMNDLAIGVLSICFDRPYEIPDYKKEEYKLAAQQLAKYEGIYSSAQIPLKITIKQEGDRLKAQASGQSPFFLTAVSETEFKFDPASLIMNFDKSQSGEIHQFTLNQGGGKYLFVKQ